MNTEPCELDLVQIFIFTCLNCLYFLQGMTPGTGVGGGAGGLGGPRGRGKNSEFKVFVGGISQATSENELRAYFSEYGNVSLSFH